MDNPEDLGLEETFRRELFDKDFFVESFYQDPTTNKLGSLDIVVAVGGTKYMFTVESYPVNVERSVEDYGANEQADGPPAYVLAEEEILPSDIANLKQQLFADPNKFDDYLIEQDVD